MDPTAVAQQMRLDLLAHKVSSALGVKGLPHVILKGPSTARWLYDPPREYRDVDLLLPYSQVNRAVRVIEEAGLATMGAGDVGEEAIHSVLMIASDGGFELDIHVSLPLVAPHRYKDPDQIWAALAPHVTDLELFAGASIPVLDLPARCLVLSLHAVASGYQSEQVREDLRRARLMASPQDWEIARVTSLELGLAALFDAGISVLEPTALGAPLPVEAYLNREGAAAAAFGFQRLAAAPLSRKPGMILREVFPSIGFMRYAEPNLSRTRVGLAHTYIRRWRAIARELPAAFSSWRTARKQAPRES